LSMPVACFLLSGHTVPKIAGLTSSAHIAIIPSISDCLKTNAASSDFPNTLAATKVPYTLVVHPCRHQWWRSVLASQADA
jgi:hypothetical protein